MSARRFLLHLVLLASPFMVLAHPSEKTERFSMAENKYEKGSLEELAAKIIGYAHAKEFEKIKPYLSWSWNHAFGHRSPEYPWRTILETSELKNISFYGAIKTPLYHNLYTIRIECLQGKRTRGSGLSFIKEGQTYKLSKNPSGSWVGNIYVTLRNERDYAKEQFSLVPFNKIEEKDNTLMVTCRNGKLIKCTFDKDNHFESLEFKVNEHWLKAQLVIFDLEGTPTFKLKD